MQMKTGLFPICYEIGGDKPGAPLFKISLLVYTPHEKISGFGEITQAVSPPLDIKTKLEGSYTYMTVMPRNVHILITATGYPPIHWPSHGGIGPVILPNVDLRIVVGEDWQSGTANYKYQTEIDKWNEVKDAPVKAVPCQ